MCVHNIVFACKNINGNVWFMDCICCSFLGTEFELAAALRADPPVNPTFLEDTTSVSSDPCYTSQCIIDILLHLQTEEYFEDSSYIDPVFSAVFDHNKVVSMTDVMKAVFNTDLTGTAFPFNPILGRFTFNKNDRMSSFEPISVQEMQKIFPGILTTTNMRLTVTMLGVSNPEIVGMLLSGTGLLNDIDLSDVTLDSTERKWVISGAANVQNMPLQTFIDKLHKGFKTTLDVSTWHIDVNSVKAVFDTAHPDFHLVMNVQGMLHIENMQPMHVCVIGNMFVLRQRNNELAIVTHCNSDVTGSFTLGEVLQNVAKVNIGPVTKLFLWDLDHFRLFLTGTPSFTLDEEDANLIGIHVTCASVLTEASGSGILIDLPMKSPDTHVTERYESRSGNDWCHINTEPAKTSPEVCRMGMPVFIRFDGNASTFIPIKYSNAFYYYRTFPAQPLTTNISIEEVLTNGLGGCGIYTSKSGLLNGSRISADYNYSTFSYVHQSQSILVQTPILGNMTFVKGFVVMENLTLVVKADYMRTPGPVYSANILGPFQLLSRPFAGNISLDLKENAWELKGCASGMTTRLKFMSAVNVSAPSTIIMKFFNFAEFDLHDPCVHVSSATDGFHGVVEGGVCFGGKQHPTPEDAFSSVASFSQCLSAADSYAQSSQVMGWELVGSPLSSLLQPVLGDVAGQIPFLNVRYLTAVLYAEGDYDGPSPVGELLGQLDISEGLSIVLRMSWPLNCGDMCAYLRNLFGDNVSFQLEVNIAFELNVDDPSSLLPPKPTQPSQRRQNTLNPEPDRSSSECSANDDDMPDGEPADLDALGGKQKVSYSDFLGVSAALAVTITFSLSDISFETYKFTGLQFQTEVGVDFSNDPPNVCVSISLGMTVVFTNPKLTLYGQIALILPDRILELTAAVDTCWDVTDTFSICDFYLFVSIDIRQPKMSGFALSVTFYLGDKTCIEPQDRLAITAAFGIRPNFMYLSVAGNFTFGGIMGYYCIDTENWPDLILVSGFPKGFTLSWAEEEVYIDYYNIEIKEGWYFQGTVSIMGYEIYGEIHDNRPDTMSISAVLEPVTFASGLVRMSASRDDTRMGPYFYSFFDFPALPTVNISGYVEVLGLGLQATMVADNTHYCLSLDGWLWGILEVHLEFEANYDIGNLANLGYRVSGYIKPTLKETIEKAVNLFFHSRVEYVEAVAGEQIKYVDLKEQQNQGAKGQVNETGMTLQTEQANERVRYFDLQDAADYLNELCPADFECQGESACTVYPIIKLHQLCTSCIIEIYTHLPYIYLHAAYGCQWSLPAPSLFLGNVLCACGDWL